MKLNFFLVVNDRGTTRTCKNKPDLAWNEVSIAISATLPDGLFKKPQLSASIVVPDEAAVAKVIEASTSDNFKDAVQQAVGMNIKIDVTSSQS